MYFAFLGVDRKKRVREVSRKCKERQRPETCKSQIGIAALAALRFVCGEGEVGNCCKKRATFKEAVKEWEKGRERARLEGRRLNTVGPRPKLGSLDKRDPRPKLAAVDMMEDDEEEEQEEDEEQHGSEMDEGEGWV